MFSIRADHREDHGAKVLTILKAIEYPVVPSDMYEILAEMLTVGDYVIEAGEWVMIVERKTWSDLAASLKDGRLKENHPKMLEAQGAIGSGCQVVYLIEGERPPDDTRVDGILIDSLVSKLDHLSMTDHCQIEYTNGAIGTAKRLLTFGKHMCTMKKSPRAAPMGATVGGSEEERKSVDVGALVKKSHEISTTKARMNILCAVPKVGPKTAKKLLELKPLATLLGGEPLAETKGISKVIIENLVAASNSPSATINMLVKINGISATTAEAIAGTFVMSQLVGTEAAAIAAIVRPKTKKKMKVGKALAARIVKLLGPDE